MSVCDIVCSNPFFLSHTTQGLNVFIWQCWREKHKYFEGGIYTWPSFCFVFYNSPAPHWSWSRLLVLTTGPLWVNSRVKLLNYLPFRLRWFALTTPVQIWLFSSVSLYVYVKTEKKSLFSGGTVAELSCQNTENESQSCVSQTLDSCASLNTCLFEKVVCRAVL